MKRFTEPYPNEWQIEDIKISKMKEHIWRYSWYDLFFDIRTFGNKWSKSPHLILNSNDLPKSLLFKINLDTPIKNTNQEIVDGFLGRKFDVLFKFREYQNEESNFNRINIDEYRLVLKRPSNTLTSEK
jgi:hypothetical protein